MASFLSFRVYTVRMEETPSVYLVIIVSFSSLYAFLQSLRSFCARNTIFLGDHCFLCFFFVLFPISIDPFFQDSWLNCPTFLLEIPFLRRRFLTFPVFIYGMEPLLSICFKLFVFSFPLSWFSELSDLPRICSHMKLEQICELQYCLFRLHPLWCHN